MRRTLIIGLAAMLAGCAAPAPQPQVITKIEVERVTLPAGLLSCTPEPSPGPAWTRQSQVADYVVRLDEAAQDCRNTVSSIATIEKAGAPAP